MSDEASQPPGATPKRRPGFWQRLLGRAPAQEVPTTTATVDEPAAAPIGMGKDSRGVELASVEDLDERQDATWMRQSTAMPGFGGKKQ